MARKNVGVLALALMILLQIMPSAHAVLQKPYSLTPTADVWTTYDPDLHYYYQQLTDAEKRLFSARYDALALGDGSLWNYQVSGLSAHSRARVNYVIINDCPELMFLPQSENLFQDGLAFLQAPDEDDLKAIPGRIQSLNALCQAVLDQWNTDSLTDYEKEIAVDRYIVQHCVYTVEEDYSRAGSFQIDDSIRIASSALVGGNAACVGYANAMLYAMRYLHIPCVAANGYYYAKDGIRYGHKWNIIQIGGSWYHYDATWNDWDSSALLADFFPYLNLSTLEIRKSHADDFSRQVLDFKNPQCNATRDNYYVRQNQMVGENWRDDISALLQNAVQAGKGALGVRFTTADAYQDALSTLLRLGCDAVFPGVDGIAFVSDDFVDFLYFYWP